MKSEDVDLEPTLVRFGGPVLHDVEVAVMDVKVASVEIEDGSAVHDLAPFEWAEYSAWPSQLFEWTHVDLAPVVDRKIPVTVGSEIASSPGSAEAHALDTGEFSTGGDHRLEEFQVSH